jgi:hypothetical protein
MNELKMLLGSNLSMDPTKLGSYFSSPLVITYVYLRYNTITWHYVCCFKVIHAFAKPNETGPGKRQGQGRGEMGFGIN